MKDKPENPQAFNWISVHNNIPSDDKQVICFDGKNVFCASYYRKGEAEVDSEIEETDGIDFDEQTGVNSMIEGWYSSEEQYADSYDFRYFERLVKYWMPLPIRTHAMLSERSKSDE